MSLGGGFATAVVATAAIVLLTPGCTNFLPSHIHDAAGEKTALDLQTKVAQYREDQSGLYDNMAANLARFQVQEEELINRMAANYTAALAIGATGFNWSKIKDNLDRVNQAESALRAEIETAMKNDLKQRGVSTANLTSAKDTISKLKAEINQEKKNAEKWQRAAERYREALAKLPSTVEGLEEQANDISSLLSQVEALDVNLLKDLETLEIDPYDFQKGIADTNESLRKQLSADLQEAPGITVLILELGLELAELDKRRAESKLASLEAREQVFEETLVYLDIANQLSRLGGNFVNTDNYSRNLMVEIENKKLDSKTKTLGKVKRISSILLALRFSVSADWIVEYQDAVFDLRLARIAHAESITESRVNDVAWQILLDSGVDALVAYHKGGLKKEDLANFFRLAQSIALFIIAA